MMPRTLFLFYTICRDPARAQELSDWYDRIHIPDVVAIPGFTACHRHLLTGTGLGEGSKTTGVRATYLSIVESDLDRDTAVSRLQSAAADWMARGRMIDLFEVVASEIVTEVNPTCR